MKKKKADIEATVSIGLDWNDSVTLLLLLFYVSPPCEVCAWEKLMFLCGNQPPLIFLPPVVCQLLT